MKSSKKLFHLSSFHINNKYLNNQPNKMYRQSSDSDLKTYQHHAASMGATRLPSFGDHSAEHNPISSDLNIQQELESRWDLQPPSRNTNLKEYQSENTSEARFTNNIRESYDHSSEKDSKVRYQIEVADKLKKIQELYIRERQYQRVIHELRLELDEKTDREYYAGGNLQDLKNQNSRLCGQIVRLKKQLLSQEFKMKMVETQMEGLKQEDDSNRLREQIKIKEDYHRKKIKQLEEEREIQIDRIVKLFETFVQDLEQHYKGIIEDNRIKVSENIEANYSSLKRIFNRNKDKQINRMGMEYISSDNCGASRLRSKSRFDEPQVQVEDNSTQVIQRVKEQLNNLNRLKERQLEEVRNVKDKYSYLDTETEYQKIYLGLIVELESLRYKRVVQKSSLEEHAEIIQLKSQIKMLSEELNIERRAESGSSDSKLKRELDILKQYIREQNQSKMKFFSDLQKTKGSNQQIYDQNSKLKKEVEYLSMKVSELKSNTKNTQQYRLLEISFNQLREEVNVKNSKNIELERQINFLQKQNSIVKIKQLQDQLRSKEVDQLKLFSEIESLQDQISKLQAQKDELMDVIKRLGANIETEHQLKTLLNKLQMQNIQLKSENQMIRESSSQGNMAKATNEACRLISERYERQIHLLKVSFQNCRKQLIATQQMNGQLLQDLRVVNQQSKTKGVAVDHLWEVKNAEYQNIMGQIKRLQTL